MVIGTISLIASYVLQQRAKSREKQFRQEKIAELRPQLLEDAKRIAEERIKAAKEARQLHMV